MRQLQIKHPDIVGKIIEGLHECFGRIESIKSVHKGEPSSGPDTPFIYTLTDEGQFDKRGNVPSRGDQILHRLCFNWQDGEAAEAELIPYLTTIRNAVDADPQLSGRIPSGITSIARYKVIWVRINGVMYRAVDFTSETTFKGR